MKPQLSVFNFSVKNQSADSIDINVDGYIVDSPSLEFYKEYWGDNTSVSYKSFRDSIPDGVKTINLIVNSGGGHVGDAMAMHDYLDDLENKGVTVNREGRGIVASAATYLIMGKNSRMSENCLFMIHEVSGIAYGDVSSMENQVKAMRKFNDMIVDFYSRETGLSSTVIGNMMKAETWMNAEDAKAKGFVKETGPKATVTNSIRKEHWPFQNKAMLNTYNSFVTKKFNNQNMDTSKITEAIQNGFNTLLEKMNLKDKATDENVKNALGDFSTSITNAVKEGAQTEESIQKLVNTAVESAVKNIGENETIKNAITAAATEATKNAAKKEDIETAVKNLITKDDLKGAIDTMTAAVSDKLGNGTKQPVGGNKNEGRKTPKNRFSGKYSWEEEAAA